MQFGRVITPKEDLQIWSASSSGFTFVISFQSRDGPGLRGPPGFVASWRSIHHSSEKFMHGINVLMAKRALLGH